MSIVLKVKRNYANKFNPYLEPNYQFIDTRFSSYAYKCLQMLALDTFKFKSPNTKIITGLKSSFICLKSHHSNIDFDCSCGFYSFKLKEDACDYSLFAKFSLVFRVKLIGDVIEHNIGYRSAGQEISSLLLTYCSEKNCEITPEYLTLSKPVKLSCFRHKSVNSIRVDLLAKSGIDIERSFTI